jgi:hypothetical protein
MDILAIKNKSQVIQRKLGTTCKQNATEITKIPNYHPNQPSGRYSCFISGRFQVQILAQRPAILIEVFCGFHHSPQANARIVPSIRPQPLDSIPFPSHYSLIIRSSHTIQSELLTTSLKKRKSSTRKKGHCSFAKVTKLEKVPSLTLNGRRRLNARENEVEQQVILLKLCASKGLFA